MVLYKCLSHSQPQGHGSVFSNCFDIWSNKNLNASWLCRTLVEPGEADATVSVDFLQMYWVAYSWSLPYSKQAANAQLPKHSHSPPQSTGWCFCKSYPQGWAVQERAPLFLYRKTERLFLSLQLISAGLWLPFARGSLVLGTMCLSFTALGPIHE